MLKVLAVGMTGGIGGVETFMTNLYQYIDHQEVHMDFLVHEEIAPHYTEIIKQYGDGEIYRVTGIKKNPLRYIKEIAKFYGSHQYDIIHLNECGASYCIYILPVFFQQTTKLIVHSHNGNSNRSRSHRIFRMIQNCRVDAQWTCSDLAAEWMFGKKRIRKYGCMMIHNGIAIDNYVFSEESRKKKRNELDLPEECIVLGSIARFEEQKNHKKIVDIFNEFHRLNPNSVLLLVGQGRLMKEIQDKVNTLGLNDSVRFLGVRNDVGELLQAMDVFLLPSLYEGLPFVAIESQAASLPMVVSKAVSDQISITDLIYRVDLEAENCIWVGAINDALSNTCRNNAKYAQILRENGYDIRNTANVVLQQYKTIVNGVTDQKECNQ